MLPEFYDGVYLPEGEHPATWAEIVERFGFGEVRARHCARLERFLERAKACGFIKVYLFGSFISSKEKPGDVDLLWVYRADANLDGMRPECKELLTYPEMKEKEGWDMFCCTNDDMIVTYMLSGFCHDKTPQKNKRGIVILELQ